MSKALPEINCGYYHEVMDRIDCIRRHIEDVVTTSLVCDHHPEIRNLVEAAQQQLGEAYQAIGHLEHALSIVERREIEQAAVRAYINTKYSK